MKLCRRSAVQWRLVEWRLFLRLRKSLRLVFSRRQYLRRPWGVRNSKNVLPITSTASFRLISITAGNAMRRCVTFALNFPAKSYALLELATRTFLKNDLYPKD